MAAPPDGGFKIASPKPEWMKKPKKRIIPDNLPEPTLSKSMLDLPKREHVIQITLPNSRKKEVSYEYDPRTQLQPNSSGSSYHGIDPEKPTRHGVFLQKSEKIEIDHPHKLGMDKQSPPQPKPKKEIKSHLQKKVEKHNANLTEEALADAKHVEVRAEKLYKGTQAVQTIPGELLIRMAMENKRENPDLRLHIPAPEPHHK